MKTQNSQQYQHIILSQSLNIGDVILTLPMAGYLKQCFPACKITLLARQYTQCVAEQSEHIDNFIDQDALFTENKENSIKKLNALSANALIHVSPNRRIAELVNKSQIPLRIGTFQKWYHWYTCNRFVNIGRRHSSLHTGQLNMRLLKPLGIKHQFTKQELITYYGFNGRVNLRPELENLFDENRFNLIVHPGSHGHSREWPTKHFIELIQSLPQDQFKIYMTGTAQEAVRFADLITACPNAVNMMGKLTLTELIAFIQRCNGLIANSTGPMHIAAALGIKTLGLFPPRMSTSPRRWAPVGSQSDVMVYKRKLNACFTCTNNLRCTCMKKITVPQVKMRMMEWAGA